MLPSQSEAPAFVEVPAGWPDRYTFLKLLGTGGTSFVLAVTDRDLERDVAIKLLREEVVQQKEALERFLKEAQVTARLEHPNIVPVYDVQKSDGLTYLVMRKVRGESLGRIIRRAKKEGSTQSLPLNDLITVFLKVCDAVAFAHDRSIVHRDIKPDNIMVGQFGEVMLVDWGAACSAVVDDRLFVGTPHYMSPERALGGPATAQSDVYALGATLFYALLLRRPLENEVGDGFWLKKTTGEIAEPSGEERARVPKALLEIALKALRANATDRYASALALANDVRDYQAGHTTWSAPFFVEAFGSNWENRWCKALPDQFEVQDNALVSTGSMSCSAFYRRRLTVGVAVEFEAMVSPGAKLGDLSVIWTEADVMPNGTFNDEAMHGSGRTFGLQLGAFSGTLAGIFRRMQSPISIRRLELESGREYTVRAEIEERMLRLFVDGQLVADHEELSPFSTGYLGVYAFYPGKSFRNLRLYSKGFPERVSPIVVGDEFFKRGLLEDARYEYHRVADAHSGTPLADEANYKAGLCDYRLGSRDEAERRWKALRSDTSRGLVELLAFEEAWKRGDHAAALELFRQLYAARPGARVNARQCWIDCVHSLLEGEGALANPWPELEPLLDLRAEFFPTDAATVDAAGDGCHRSGRWQEVIDNFPEAVIHCVNSLFALGRTKEVLDRFSYISFVRQEALLRLGRISELKPGDELYSAALLLSERTDEALAVSKHHNLEVLLAANDPEALLDQNPPAPSFFQATALRRLGRWD
ncbi:MAG TPA: serine/threonine-protein kinase, partial [Polyangiaceae bacterium]|nr:serine/threonine-protein kinase [Polyangiaceae bacterium]